MKLDEESSLRTFNTVWSLQVQPAAIWRAYVARLFQKKQDHAYEGIPNVMDTANDILALPMSMMKQSAARCMKIGLKSKKLQFMAEFLRPHDYQSRHRNSHRQVGRHQKPEGAHQLQRAHCSRHDHVHQLPLSQNC